MGGSSSQEAPLRRALSASRPVTFDALFVRQWVDARDREGRWYEAQVVSKNDHTRAIVVKFKGFLPKWNEEIEERALSERIASLNSRVPAPISQVAPIKCFVGEELQVQDTTGKWIEGAVIDTDRAFHLVKVHYLGWPSRWDEWLPIDSYRVLPLHIENSASACKSGDANSLVRTVAASRLLSMSLMCFDR